MPLPFTIPANHADNPQPSKPGAAPQEKAPAVEITRDKHSATLPIHVRVTPAKES